MFNRKFTMPIVAIVIIIIIGFTQINIINTKALSPIGNTEDNYELVSAEFGEDFTAFIKDNAEVKIYTADGERDGSIRVKDNEFRLKKDNQFINLVSTTGTKIKEAFLSVKGKVDNKIEDINKSNLEKENKNDELDSTVNDFIKNREKSGNSEIENDGSIKENNNTNEENNNSVEENESSIEKPKSEETTWEDNLE